MAIVLRLRFAARQSALRQQFDLGSDVTATVEARDRDTNALTAVAGVSFVVTQADGEILSPSPGVVTEAVGIYSTTWTPDQVGIWAVEVTSTTPGVVIDRREIEVISDSLPAQVPGGAVAVTSVNGQAGPTVTIDFEASLEASRGEVSGFPFAANGVGDDTAVWADFVNYCLTHDVVGVLPAGTILIGNSPGTSSGADQINAPAIRNATRPLRIRGAGEGLTILKAAVGARSASLVALVSGPILRLVDGVALHLSDLTIDGGVTTVPTVESGMRALTLSSPASDAIARDVCTMIETDNVPDVRIERVTVRGFYGHRDNTAWAADPAAFRSRRTGGLCIHRASRVRVRDLTLDHVSAREGVYFANCQDVQIDGFSFGGVAAEQDARGSHALSTALNIFGPETRDVRVSNFRIVNNAGSAANFGGQDIALSGFTIEGDAGTSYGDGLDFGVEHQIDAFGETHPRFQRLMVSDGNFRECNRYSLRAYHVPEKRGGEITLDNLLFHRCYQGPEVADCDNVHLGTITVREAFYRADYEPSGRAVYAQNCDRVAWNALILDGGDSETDTMRYGVYFDRCKEFAGGVAIIRNATHSHFVIYQAASGTAAGDSASGHVGHIIATQTIARDGASIFAPLHLGRNNLGVAGLSAGLLLYNGAPALEQPGVLSLSSTAPALGIQRAVLGTPNQSASYNDLLASVDFVNGDASGGLSDLVRARITARTRGSNGRGAWVEIETAGRNDARAVVLAASEHGSLILPPSASSFTPRTRRLGEQWTTSDGQVWRCTAAGREASTAAPVGVTATADGTTAIVVSSAAALDVGDLIFVGATGPREIVAIVGTTVTLSATVPSGTGLAVTSPECSVVRLAAIINPTASYADGAAAAAAGVPVNGFYRRTDGTLAWRVS